MLNSLFGNDTAMKVLLFLANYEDGYAAEIADTFNISLNMVQKQLQKFEETGILVSYFRGRTRLFTWNPRYPLRKELLQFLNKALALKPKEEIRRYYRKRRRPGRLDKPFQI